VITNYATLAAAILDWYEGDDLSGQQSNLVQLAEVDLNLRLMTRQRYATYDIVATGAVSYALPTAFRKPLFLVGTAVTQPKPEWQTPEVFFSRVGAYASGDPDAYTFVGSDIYFAPNPTGGTYRLGYTLDIPPLESNTTNWLCTLSPNTYLFAALWMAGLYVQDDPAAARWKAHYEGALALVQGDSLLSPPSGRSVAG